MDQTGDKVRRAELRTAAQSVFLAGVEAADPARAVRRALRLEGEWLEILLAPGGDETAFRRGNWRSVRPIAIGKAAIAMARAVGQLLPDNLFRDGGVIVTNHENLAELVGGEVPGFELIGAGHPLPDAGGVAGARRVAEIADSAGEGELVLVLVSGGGSALVPAPVPPITLAEKIATTDLLLACGADIVQINCVRKHLSTLKGGGLVRHAAPADLHALILSDVIGDDLSAIASGPTVPDETSFAQAIAILEDGGVWDRVPASVRTRLEQGRDGMIEETPKPGDKIFERAGSSLIGSNGMSLAAAEQAACRLGFETRIVSAALCGEAQDAAGLLLSAALAAETSGRPLALLAGGETTVTLRGRGRGGRNQELALAFAMQAKDRGLDGHWVFLSGGTDGRDGPTDAAGGLVDPSSLARIQAAGGDAAALLANNDSYRAFELSGDLLKPGATGTNVADLQVLLLEPSS
jgi:hydroxypyruvate reductase